MMARATAAAHRRNQLRCAASFWLFRRPPRSGKPVKLARMLICHFSNLEGF